MSVLVGAANKSFPSSTGTFTGSDRNPIDMPGGRGEPGPSGDGFVVPSPENLLRQLSRSSLGTSGDGFVAPTPESLRRQLSKSSICDSEEGEEDHEEENMEKGSFVVSPLVPLKDQLEKDKDDESLRRWKEQLLGSVVLDPVEEGVDPEVRILNLSIQSAGRPDIIINLPLPNNSNSNSNAGSSSSVHAQRRQLLQPQIHLHCAPEHCVRVEIRAHGLEERIQSGQEPDDARDVWSTRGGVCVCLGGGDYALRPSCTRHLHGQNQIH